MKHINDKGVVLIEFVITASIFFLMIFAMFEFGLMLSIKNGLQAGMFYAVRHSATQEATFETLKDTFVAKYTEYAFGSLDKDVITVVNYSSLSDRVSNTNPQTILDTSQVTNPNEHYLFSVDAPYTYITSLFQTAGTSVTIKLKGTVYNENF